MLLPAVYKYFLCKFRMVFHPVQYLGLNVVAIGSKVMVNGIFTIVVEAVVVAFCFLDA